MAKGLKKITTPVRLLLQRLGLWPTRSTFLKQFPKHAVCAELGVFQGDFSRTILETTQPRKLHLIDPWWKVIGERYGEWSRKHNDGELLTTRKAYEQAKANVERADHSGEVEFHIEDDVKALQTFPDDYFDWVYIDSSHAYEHTWSELEVLRHKVKPDGLIAGHDWYPDPNHRHHGVYRAVNEFCEKYDWRIKKVDSHYVQWCIEPC